MKFNNILPIMILFTLIKYSFLLKSTNENNFLKKEKVKNIFEEEENIPRTMTTEEKIYFNYLQNESIRSKCFVHHKSFFYDLNKIKFPKGKK